MRFLLAVFTAFIAFAAYADDSSQISELRAKCEKEKVSMFRENNRTPSCDRLDKIMREGKNQTMVLCIGGTGRLENTAITMPLER